MTIVLITKQLGCTYGGCLIKGGSFLLRLMGDKEVEKQTHGYIKMGRSYAWNGDFLTTDAARFTGPERYPWLARVLFGYLLKFVINKQFDEFAHEWGCYTPLNERVYSQNA